jgi:hypothetical protein
MLKMKFSMQFRGFGYDKKLQNNEQPSKPPDQLIVTELAGPGLIDAYFYQ